MNAFLRYLMLAALFLVPAFGQTTIPPDQIPTDTQVRDTPVAEPPTLVLAPAFAKTTTPPDQIAMASQVRDTPVAKPATPFRAPALKTTAPPDQIAMASQVHDTPVAEPPTQLFPVEKAEEPGAGYPMFRAIGGLGLVTFLLIAVYFAARKFAPRYFAKGASDKNLKIIETLSMGDKRSISMIQVGNSRFLVGNTAHQINLLTGLPESISVVSEPETLSVTPKASSQKESVIPFKKLFEIEKKRPAQFATNPLPDDIRNKMRQLREALER